MNSWIMNIWFDIKTQLGWSEYESVNAIFNHLMNRYVRFPVSKQINFLIEFNEWMKAGSQPQRACYAMIEVHSQSRRQGGKASVIEEIAQKILLSLGRGDGVTGGMKDYFHPEIIALFKVGEETGTTVEMLEQYVLDKNMIKKVNKDGLKQYLYPVMVSLLIIAIFFMIGMKLEGAESFINMNAVPDFAMMLFDVANFTYQYIIVLFIGLIGTFIYYKHWSKITLSYERDAVLGEYDPQLRFELDKFFPFSITREYNAMLMLKNVALLAKTGMTLNDSFNHLKQFATPYMRQHYDFAIRKLHEKSANAGVFLDTGLLSTEIKQYLMVVSEAPNADSKIKAIIFAGEKSTDLYMKFIQRINKVLVILAWFFALCLMGILAMGFMDIYFNINAIFKK